MIRALVRNMFEILENEKIDGIQNAANGIGPMGRGIAGVIRQEGGQEIQDNAYAVCKVLDPKAGQAYSTISGKLQERGIKKIIHAVTMKQPGGFTSIEICESAFKAALLLAKKEGITRLGCTALGTGVGGLDSEKIAEMMVKVAREIKDIDIIFIDQDNKFIHKINKILLPK
jgi:O-acetyl-ADP-ribose deacetylase (regulator of RNase III)